MFLFRSNTEYVNYSIACRTFNILSLVNRRTLNDMITLFKILDHEFPSSNLLELFNFNVPYRTTRHSVVFFFQKLL